MISNETNQLVLQSVIDVTLDKINVISLRNNDVEFFRKVVTAITDINNTKKTFTFFISETEGNGNITSVGLHGNGATAQLNSGTIYATQVLNVIKDNTQSLTIDWTLEVR